MKKTYDIILVDGSSYLFRAFHGLPPLMTSQKEPTGAIYGVINMLRKLINTYQPKQMAVVFDAKGKNFRHELFADYKANRPPMPDELRVQIEPLHDIIRALGLPLIVVDGVEADDVLGTYAKQAHEKNKSLLISTGDKDLAQLVNDNVTLINTMNDTLTDEAKVIEKFGVTKDQIIDYLALIGDTSDNIPGVPKVGPKTAAKWLKEYKNLDEIIENAEKFGGKIGENLRASLEQLPISYELATIKCDVPLEIAIEDLEQEEANTNVLFEFYSRFEFKNWIKELQQGAEFTLEASNKGEAAGSATGKTETSLPKAVDRPAYTCITAQKVFDEWLAHLESVEVFAFDTETTSLDYMQAEVVGISFATEEKGAAYVPLAHSYDDVEEQLNREAILGQLKPLLEGSAKKIIGQHIKYDKNVLLKYGINLTAIAHDTMLQSYVADATATRHDMDSLANKYLSEKTIKFEDVAGKGAKQITFDKVKIDVASDYAAEDADITLRLYKVLADKLAENETVKSVYDDMELPLIDVLAYMETTGVNIDADKLYVQSQELSQLMVEAELNAHNAAGESFNLASPKQIQAILFEKQGLPVIRKTPKGQPSTAEDVLQELADTGHDIPQQILRYRSLSKLKSTYADKLPEMIDRDSGRVHTSYHQAVTSTGRLSSSDPNLQNIPIRTEEGRRIRQAFVAPSGYKIVAADYSQIELRIMAHLSGDEALLKAFVNNEDIHKSTAAEVFCDGDMSAVQDEHRRSAKAINFGLIYGMSAFGLAKQLGIARGQAQSYIDTYFDRYPGVKNYMDITRENAKETGFVETVFGRRLYLPDINARNGQVRQYAERTAINAPMQGTAADIIKKAMLAVYAYIKQNADIRMVMQVHDELVFEVPENKVDVVSAEIKSLMENAASISVPLVVEVGVGDNWDEAH